MLTHKQEKELEAELLMVAIQSVQYVGDGNTFLAMKAVDFNCRQEEVHSTLNVIVRKMIDKWFAEHRVLKNRPPELDDSAFQDWLYQEFDSWAGDRCHTDVDIMISAMYDTVEDAVSDWNTFKSEMNY